MKRKDTMDVIYRDGNPVSIAQLQNETKKSIVKSYKEIRKSKKMTQIELSTITGIPQPNITRFESDKSNPTLEMLIKMAAALDMKLNISFEKIPEE